MNLNPIDFEYIDGKNTYPLQDYINENISSNISNNNIYISSNTYSSNITLNNFSKLNDNLYFKNGSNLYLKNNIPFGEIRFSTAINYPQNSNIDHGTRIDYFGKLEVYHNYNILQPVYPAGWYNVSDEILQLKADGINTDAQLTLLDAGLLYLTDQNNSVVDKIINLEAFQKVITNAYGQGNTYEAFQSILFSGNSPVARAATRQAYDLIKFQSQQNYQNSLALGVLYGVGIGIGGAILGYVSSRLEQEKTSNALYKNSNLTTAEKDDIFNSNIQSNVINISNFNFSTSNLAINQGFLNSNTIAQQHISSLNTNQLTLNQTNISNIFVSSNVPNQQLIQKLRTNEITLNNKAITKFSLDNLDNWIKTTYGIYYDITNGTLAINSTPNLTDFFRVGGQTTIQGDLISETKMKVNSASVGIPNFGVNGGAGDKLIFKEGSVVLQPYSLGLNTNELWYSTPSSATHKFYINASPITTISSTGLTTTGFINATTNIQENGTNLTAKYLQLSGGTMTGAITLPNTIWSIKSADNVNRVNYATNGATYFKSGNTTGNSFVFKNTADTSEILTLADNGNLSVIGNFKSTTGIITGDATYQLMIAPPTSTSASTLQTIQQGVGYNQILALQVAGGNVGIGTNSTSAKLEVIGNVNISVSNPILTIKSTLETEKSIIYISTPFNSSSALKTALISEGYSGWGRSKLHFCVNNSGNPPGTATDYNTAPTYNATITDARMTILPNGNVGINNTLPTCLLSVNKVDYKVLSFYDNNLTNSFQFVGLGAYSGLCFNNFGTGDAFQFRVGISTTSANELMRINGDGSVCIGTNSATSTNTKLTISGASSGYTQPLVNITQTAAWNGNYALQVNGYTNLGGVRINGGDVGNTIYQSTLNANMAFAMNPGNTTGGNMLFYTQGAAGNIIFNTSGANERLRITPGGNVGIGTNTARSRLDVYNGDIIIRSINEGTNATLFFGTPNTTSTDALKCALICQGMSTWSRSKLHISLNNTADNNAFYNAAIADACATFDYNGNVGIGNTIPLDDGGNNTFLCLGSSSINGSCGNLVIAARNSAGTGHRHFRTTIDTIYFTFSIGDFGSGNTIGTFVQQFIMSYLAPSNSLLISASGQVIMPFGYTTSDERIKTDITTIDNALWKVSQLRGVEYTHIQEGIRSIGVIAQEVENIIPEVVYTDTERDNLKSVNYSGLVGLLINAIKEQQEEINNLKYILRKNNIQ